MSREKLPAWRLFPGKFPTDVQVCAYQACITAFAVIMSIVLACVYPEPNSRKGIVQMAWTTAFWTYMGCCLQIADIVIDRQARYELILQEQGVGCHGQHHETGITTAPTGPKGLNSDSETLVTTQKPPSIDLYACEAQIQPRKGGIMQRLNDAILAEISRREYSSAQLTRRFTIACTLMILGLILLPVIIHLGQKLLLPEDDIENMATNIPSWSLLFWSCSLLCLSKYGSILQKRKEREEEMAREKGKQDLPEQSGAQRDEEAGQYN